MCVCIYVYVYTVYVCMYISTAGLEGLRPMAFHAKEGVCACVYVYMNIYTYTHTYTYTYITKVVPITNTL